MKTRPIKGCHPIHRWCNANNVSIKCMKMGLGLCYDSNLPSQWNRGLAIPTTIQVHKIEKLTRYEVTLDDIVTYYNRVRRTGIPSPNPPIKKQEAV
jgi:hypothetical protein